MSTMSSRGSSRGGTPTSSPKSADSSGCQSFSQSSQRFSPPSVIYQYHGPSRFFGIRSLLCASVVTHLAIHHDLYTHAIHSISSNTNDAFVTGGSVPIHPPSDRKLPSNEGVAIARYEFPSVEDRFQYYMGDWYNRTDWELSDCSSLVEGPVISDGKLAFSDRDLVFSLETLTACSDLRLTGNKNVRNYCTDARDVVRRFDAAGGDDDDRFAVFHFGDSYSHRGARQDPLPAVGKSRPGLFEKVIDDGPRPIVWPLNVPRHYGDLEAYHVRQAGREVPWEDKLPAVVWRGAPTGFVKETGRRIQLLSRWIHYDPKVVDVAFHNALNKADTPFAKEHLVRDRMSPADMTRYKYLLSVEGNDVASGLKWMLYSNSVVLMPPPTRASWAMEDLLLPFVHYIPLSDDLSNLLEMIQWAERHQEACREISSRATDFIERLWLSDQARADTEYLKEKLAASYANQFQKQLSKCRREGSGRTYKAPLGGWGQKGSGGKHSLGGKKLSQTKAKRRPKSLKKKKNKVMIQKEEENEQSIAPKRMAPYFVGER